MPDDEVRRRMRAVDASRNTSRQNGGASEHVRDRRDREQRRRWNGGRRRGDHLAQGGAVLLAAAIPIRLLRVRVRMRTRFCVGLPVMMFVRRVDRLGSVVPRREADRALEEPEDGESECDWSQAKGLQLTRDLAKTPRPHSAVLSSGSRRAAESTARQRNATSPSPAACRPSCRTPSPGRRTAWRASRSGPS